MIFSEVCNRPLFVYVAVVITKERSYWKFFGNVEITRIVCFGPGSSDFQTRHQAEMKHLRYREQLLV